MSYVVRVKIDDDQWNYTTTGFMQPVKETNSKAKDELRMYFVQTKPKADETYRLICTQAKHRGFKAVALSDVYVFNDRFSERSVLEYREF